MEFPVHYYLFLGAILLIVVLFVYMMFRRTKHHAPAGNPYVEALKHLIEGSEETAYLNLQQAVRSGTAPTDAYIKLGALLRERGDATRALQIHQSLTVKTNLSKNEKLELFTNLAEDYAAIGNSAKAAQVLESAIRNLGLRDAAIYVMLAKHYHVLGEDIKAYETLKEAKKQGGLGDRELALYLTTAAERLVERGDLKEARKLAQKALKRDPECAPCLMLLGSIAEQTDNVDEAIGRWKRAAMLSPQLADTALAKLGSSLYDRGRFGDIENVYNEVRAARVADETASLSLAAFYRKQGRGEEAIQLLEDYLSVHPESVRGTMLLTSLYAKYRDTEALEGWLDKAVGEATRTESYTCAHCQLQSNAMRWHCPRCNSFDTFSTNHAL